MANMVDKIIISAKKGVRDDIYIKPTGGLSIQDVVGWRDKIIISAKKGVRDVILNQQGDYPYKMLLVGETGSGKTSFLNLLYNYNLVLTLG